MASVDTAAQLRESDFDEPAILIKITNVDSPVLRSRYGLYERVRREWAVSLDMCVSFILWDRGSFGSCRRRLDSKGRGGGDVKIQVT